MSEWQTAIWQDVLTIKNGKSQKKVANPDGRYPIYGSGGVMGYADDYLCEAETTVIGRKGSINKPLYVREKFWNVDTAFGLCAGEKLDNRFLYYFCITYNFLKHNKATTLPSLTKADLLKIKIPLPPLAEQQKIAAILDAADQLRQKDQQLIEHYTRLGQALFLEMFGDPLSGDTYQLGENLEILGGYAFKSADFTEEGIPLIKIGTVNKGYFDISNFSFLPESFSKKYSKWLVTRGDILMSLTGTVGKDDYGNVELATGDYNHYFLNQRVAKISPSNNDYLTGFLFGMLSHKKTKKELTKISRGVRQANISNKDLMGLKMIKPPIADQQKYVDAINLIDQQKQQAQASLEKSESLFNSLLQRAFKGELTGKC